MLAHDAYGRDGSPRLVLLHGWPLSRTIWSEVAPRVAAAGFRVVCPDLPGFGESPPLPEARWTVEAFADAVAPFLRDRGSDRVAVAGHSFGGYVALALAELDIPRIAGLGLVSSRATADSEAARAGRRATIEKVRAEGSRALLPDLAAKLVAPDAPEALRTRAARVVESAPAEGIIAGLAAMAARPNRTAVLEALPRPLLVLHGEADQLIPIADAARPARQAGPMDRVLLPGVGHMPMWEAPDRTAAAFLGWLRSAHGS
ncbi:MAG TPA: alpha/beta hydrolase [Thermoplasmata archaeon]|nr:alpha/beta hydrolase [Thermoplasmata archaeon]